MTLYLPPHSSPENKPLIFLAGPVVGAPRWQNQAYKLLESKMPGLNVACPRYMGLREEEIGDWIPGVTNDQQIDWETSHLQRAADKGVILFWLAREKKHMCQRPYAQTSRFELGEWVQKHIMGKGNVVVGIEPGFSGEDYIRHRVQEALTIPMRDNLEGTCESALSMLPN